MSNAEQKTDAPAAPAMIPFIDLAAQQARIKTEIEAGIQDVLSHGKYIMGPEVAALEQQLAEFCGAKHAITCSSGTDALVMGLMAFGIGPGHAVVVPSFTFCATAEAIVLLGATPIFADCLEDTFNIDPASATMAIEKARAENLEPKGIVAVDLFGQPADYDALQEIADANDMWVMSDSAQGFGSTYKGRKSGTYGAISCTSFFPAKPLGCYGDGGAVFTDNDEYAEIMRSVRVHGKGSHKYDNVRIGLNARLDTMQAAILKPKLSIFGDEVEKRNAVANQYAALMGDVASTPFVRDDCVSAWAQYTVVLPEGKDRAAVQAVLKAHGVPSAVYYPLPLHQQTAYKSSPSATGGALPVCESLAERVFSLPMHPYMPQQHIEQVANAVKAALEV